MFDSIFRWFSVVTLSFLALLATAGTSSLMSDEPESPVLTPIPDWAESQIAETLARFQEWRGSDQTVLFPIVTDVHSETHRQGTVNGDPEQLDWSDTKNHIYIAQHAAVAFGADFIADLGDFGIDRYADYVPSTPEDLYWRVAAQLHIYQNFTAVPVLHAIGNHDHGNDHARFSNRVFGETFNVPTFLRGVPIKTDPDFDYGYYDIPEKKTRAFFLNSSDEGYYGYSTAQLQFMADNLRMPEGWTALLCQHFCVERSIGIWNSAPHIRANRGELWTEILRSFLTGTKGESEGVVWDFTGNKDCRLAGCFCGDSHYDNQGKVDGILHVISQGFGDVLPENMPEGAVNTKFDRASCTLIDVVAIKPEKRQIKIFRIGAGGEARDREFDF